MIERIVAALLAPLLLLAAVGARPYPGPRPQPKQPVIYPGPWKLAWHDEFNGAGGTAPDPAKWYIETIACCGNEVQEYVNDRRTSAHDGHGNMVLTAIAEPGPTSGRPFISGRLSNGFVAWNGTGATPYRTTYGRWVARMLLPAGQGAFPAFWTLGDWESIQHWPRTGEIDVMEWPCCGVGPYTHGGVHTTDIATDSGHVGVGGHGPVGVWAAGWHTWAIDWEPGKITWYIDWIPWQTITRAQVEAAGGRWVFDGIRPQAPILNLAVGGDWAGAPVGWTTQEFKIDYVRIYKGSRG